MSRRPRFARIQFEYMAFAPASGAMALYLPGSIPVGAHRVGGGNTCYWPDERLLTAGLSPITLRMSTSVPLVESSPFMSILSSLKSLRKPSGAI